MNKASGLARVSLVAAVVVAACGASGTPTPAPPTVRPALPAGAYTTALFEPRIGFSLPDGWVIAADAADYVALQPAVSEVTGIYVFRSPVAASQDIECPLLPAAGAGTAAVDLVDWIRARPGLDVSDPQAVTIGGLEGLRVDIRIVDGWLASCPFAEGLPTVPLFVSPTDADFRWVVAGTERLRLDILDVPAGGTVVVDIDAFQGSLMDAFLPAAAPIVAGMSFGP
ncbi:MAG: hypothetical protein AB1736_15540 [Chloroflexota bacterium]